MGYEQGELLSCIDNGQLPAMLAEQLESNYSYLFYGGCIIAEVRDYRKVYSHNRAEVHHVLLKPTTQVKLNVIAVNIYDKIIYIVIMKNIYYMQLKFLDIFTHSYCIN